MGYFRSAVKGMSWVGMFRGATKGIAFLRTVILARLLTPTQFGIFGIAALMLGLLEMLTETGINVFIVQEEEGDTLKEHLNTAWVVSILRGFIIAILILLTAPLIAGFFHKPEAVSLIRLMAFVPFFRGFINPAIVNLQKHLDFRKEFVLRTITAVVDATIAILLAIIWRSPTSLVIGMSVGVLVEAIISLVWLKPTPHFIFTVSHWRTIASRGKWVTMAGILNYFANKGPDYAIGKFLNATVLGFYQMASNLSLLAVIELNEVFNRVNFPIYVRIGGDKSRLTKAFIKHTLVTIGLLIPITIILIAFPRQCLSFVAGPQWLDAAPLVQGLAVFGFIANIGNSAFPLFLALKKQNYLTLVTLVQVSSIFIGIIPLLLRYGIMGAIYALIFSALAILPFKFVLSYKCLHD